MYQKIIKKIGNENIKIDFYMHKLIVYKLLKVQSLYPECEELIKLYKIYKDRLKKKMNELLSSDIQIDKEKDGIEIENFIMEKYLNLYFLINDGKAVTKTIKDCIEQAYLQRLYLRLHNAKLQ